MIKKPKMIIFFAIALGLSSCSSDKIIYQENVINETETVEEEGEFNLSETVPAGPNSWVINSLEQDGSMIYKNGIYNWESLDDVIRTYVKIGSGQLNVGFNMKSSDGTSKIRVKVGNDSKEIDVSNSDYEIVEVGSFTVTSGYNYVEIQGLEKSGTYIGDIKELLLGGSATTGGVVFVPTDNFHFGRRGPSVHLRYVAPSGKDVQWFYNEVTIPEGEDEIGSFFMANGLSQGYFGMQVNSDSERRILFSIWSAFSTNDPSQIPDDFKVINLGNGNGVAVKDFGNEGSGKQSIKVFDWQAGTTYKFLLKGEPSSVSGSTDYTAYFYAPEVGDWELIASLRRPQTTTHLTGLHSFLENFNPSTGFIAREGNYGNQWVYTTDNTWNEMTSATFTADATAGNGHRLDYQGGTNGSKFFLKNCGFFNDNVNPGSDFTRSAGTSPNIDFSQLPVPVFPIEPTLLDRSAWTVTDYSTEEVSGEGSTGRAIDVLDDDTETYWHSCWNGDCNSAAYPHYLAIDMGVMTELEGLQLNQRNGSRKVKNITIELSSDNTNWTSLGDFEILNTPENQNVDFGLTETTRYIKVTMNSSFDGDRFAAMAEINAYIY